MKPFVFTHILPGELAEGYEGHVYGLNGVSPEAGNELLRATFGLDDNGRQIKGKVEVLAGALGLSAQTLICEHTIQPFARAFVRFSPGIPFGAPNATANFRASEHLRSPNAYFCRDCIRDDIQSAGRAYWHREHQIPGIYCCHIHFRSLASTTKPHPFLHPPSAHSDEVSLLEHQWAERMRASVTAMAYAEIAMNLLFMSAPLSGYGMVQELKRRAAEQLVEANSERSLTDLLRRSFDSAWLEQVIPEFRDRGTTAYPTIEKAITVRRASIRIPVYVAALAALYPSASDAIERMLTAGSVENDSHTIGSPSLSGEQTRQIERAYVRTTGNLSRAAQLLGSSIPATRRALISRSLPSLDGISPHLLACFLKKFVDQRKSFREALFTVGLDRKSAENISRQCLQTTRDVAERLRRRFLNSGRVSCTISDAMNVQVCDGIPRLVLESQPDFELHQVFKFLNAFVARRLSLQASAYSGGLPVSAVEGFLRIALCALSRTIAQVQSIDLIQQLRVLHPDRVALFEELERLIDEP
ncbi:TniQ family protein [Variovorax sp. YR216]|uniref:TniQ family protein n=1 Tax=Variovorax sp. YR216 TaxID=1882828 RepID=UPI00089A07FE|nr:TniQ family protein [Variovorax sp. YR216]SEB19873.1 TniQ protein [Variovorax sp. YR216]